MFISKKWFKRILITIVSLILAYYAMIAYLITLDNPQFEQQIPQEMSAKQIDDLGFEQRYKSQPAQFIMRDSAILTAQHFTKDSALTVLVLHGILSSSYMNNRFAGLISESANAQVYSLDLRGHGSSGGKPGDVSYIGQYVDDVADVVAHIKTLKPNGKIIIAGHSMGGGISLRYSMEKGVPDVDGYLLFAPQLGDNSPTNVFPADSTIHHDESFMAIHLPRLIGLALLNLQGIAQWNDLPVFFFNLPEQMPINKYTFRSSASMAPTDYKLALQSVKIPLLVMVGENDEAFNAAAYKAEIETHSRGEFHLVKGQTHNGIRHDVLAMNHVRNWINEQFTENGMKKEVR